MRLDGISLSRLLGKTSQALTQYVQPLSGLLTQAGVNVPTWANTAVNTAARFTSGFASGGAPASGGFATPPLLPRGARGASAATGAGSGSGDSTAPMIALAAIAGLFLLSRSR